MTLGFLRFQLFIIKHTIGFLHFESVNWFYIQYVPDEKTTKPKWTKNDQCSKYNYTNLFIIYL